MTDPIIPQRVLFPDLGSKPVVATFDREQASSDGGAVLLKAAERVYDLVKRFARCLVDTRAPEKIRHTLEDLIGQRVFGIACGHPDGNDADHLAEDPIHKLLLGRELRDPLICHIEVVPLGPSTRRSIARAVTSRTGVKELLDGLQIDRTNCCRFLANQFSGPVVPSTLLPVLIHGWQDVNHVERCVAGRTRRSFGNSLPGQEREQVAIQRGKGAGAHCRHSASDQQRLPYAPYQAQVYVPFFELDTGALELLNREECTTSQIPNRQPVFFSTYAHLHIEDGSNRCNRLRHRPPLMLIVIDLAVVPEDDPPPVAGPRVNELLLVAATVERVSHLGERSVVRFPLVELRVVRATDCKGSVYRSPRYPVNHVSLREVRTGRNECRFIRCHSPGEIVPSASVGGSSMKSLPKRSAAARTDGLIAPLTRLNCSSWS